MTYRYVNTICRYVNIFRKIKAIFWQSTLEYFVKISLLFWKQLVAQSRSFLSTSKKIIAASVLLHQQCRSEQLIKRKIKIESLSGKEKSEFQEKNLTSRAKCVSLLLPVHNFDLLLLLFYLALKAWCSLAKPLGPSPTSPAASCLVEAGHRRWGYSQRIGGGGLFFHVWTSGEEEALAAGHRVCAKGFRAISQKPPRPGPPRPQPVWAADVTNMFRDKHQPKLSPIAHVTSRLFTAYGKKTNDNGKLKMCSI